MKALKSTLMAAGDGIQTLASLQIVTQAGWLAVAKVVQGCASIAAAFVIARNLGPALFGQLSLAIAAASFVAAAATLGLEQIATRELVLDANARDRTVFSALRRMRFAGALAGSCILLGLAFLPATRNLGISSLLVLLCLLPLVQIGDLWEWRLIAAGQSRRVASVAVVVSPLAALARIAFALQGAGVVTFAWVLIAEWAVRSTLLSVASRRLSVPSSDSAQRPAPATIALLRDSAPLLLSSIAVFVYMRIDQFMIAGMLGSSQVGLYSAVVTLAEVPLILPPLLLRAALPTLTRQSATDPAHRDATIAKLMRTGFYVHALVAVLLSVLAEPIVVLLYGEPFRAAANAFRLQVLAAPFVALGVLSSAWLVLLGCTGHAIRRTVIGAIANIALNLLLIPRYGIAGAAAATLVAQVIATYAVDAFYRQTRELFIMKTRALVPGFRGSP
jgi:O-antigen/teichoic acid export membrane protein